MKEIKSFPFTDQLSTFPQRRYVIVERPDGIFSITEQYLYQSSDEDGQIYSEGWASLGADGIYLDAASAIREVQRLIEVTGQDIDPFESGLI
ncbi:hypothetical protein [Roseibium sediminis]|uniref:hypothetical protein n=1 Tax=Roseibium sediminis TaxID=1775174 RepID=UPI00123D2CFD|nr:hypothetical protein [Roseibium sediminis]